MASPVLLLALAAAFAGSGSKKPAAQARPPSGNRPCAEVHFFQVEDRFFALLESRGRLQPNVAVGSKGSLHVWSPTLKGWYGVAHDVGDHAVAKLAAIAFVDANPEQ